MGPAELASRQRPGLVRAPAIRHQDGGGPPQQGPGGPGPPAGMDQEHRHQGRGRDPQPRPLPALVPAGLIDVDHRLLPDVAHGLDHRSGHRRARRLLARRHASHRQLNPAQIGQQAGRGPLAQVVDPGAHGDRRRQPRPEGPRRDPGGRGAGVAPPQRAQKYVPGQARNSRSTDRGCQVAGYHVADGEPEGRFQRRRPIREEAGGGSATRAPSAGWAGRGRGRARRSSAGAPPPGGRRTATPPA